MDETIYSESPLGKRLEKVKRKEKRCLFFKGKKIPLVAKITLGRDSTNQVVIDDQMVSRFHALIQKINDSFFIQDLNSSNGTFVNDKPVPPGKYIQINKNDNIKFGSIVLTIG